MIEMRQPWEMAVSHSLAFLLKIGVLGRAGRSQNYVDLEENSQTQGIAASTRSVITCLTIGDMSGLDLNTLMSSRGNSAVRDIKGKENQQFNSILFGNITTWTVGWQPVNSRGACENINKGELHLLPPSKADGQHMCLAWHTKGICNPDCLNEANHREI